MRLAACCSVLLASLAGCSGGDAPTTPVVAKAAVKTPSANEAIRVAAERFLSSVVAGDADEAMRWLTPAAANRAAQDPSIMAPLGFEVRSLEVGDVRLVSEREAAAQCWLTEPGADDPEEVCCLLKLGTEGWRVCGLACETEEGKPPAVIQFEQPAGGNRPRRVENPQFVDSAATPNVRTAAAGDPAPPR